MIATTTLPALIYNLKRLSLECRENPMESQSQFRVELEQEEDGRWIAEVLALPGVMTYGATRGEALAAVQALALRVLADRLEHRETLPDQLLNVSFTAA